MRAWTWWLALALAAARARELDPAACAARFDVQRDKIIRTEESREMGARYLAELDVGSRAECLRLCCETDACDVFVYEEKSTGSCYLFKCGPPEDFRCKFTAHGNFSSGVLALSRHLAELQDQERLAHHERELAGLRNSAATSIAPPASPTPQPLQLQPQQGQQQQQQHHQPLQAAPPPPREPPPPPPPPRRCSRYQFECRRGGECIAVYNACDGVPQCADGSDEAPELGCPAPPTAPAATTATTAHAAPTAPTAPRAHPDPVPAAPRAQVVQVMEGGAGAPAALWPHRLAQAQRRYPVLTSGGGGGDGAGAAGGAGSAPHIFSHQGGLLQPAPLAGVWPRRSWPPDQRNEVDNVDGGVGGAGGAAGWGYSVGRLEPWGEERRAWPVPPRLDPELPVYVAAKTMPELPLYPEQQQQQAALRDAPKKGFELETGGGVGSAPVGPAAPPPPSVESTTKKKALKDMAAGSGPGGAAAPPAGPERVAVVSAAHEARAPWGDESDGLSEHPPAAVLLLVLGSLLTAALGALLGCRARAARRRRRAHPRLALDADYLVNGMYL